MLSNNISDKTIECPFCGRMFTMNPSHLTDVEGITYPMCDDCYGNGPDEEML